MAARNYKNNSPATSLVSSITSSDINITVNDSAGFPGVPFTATLDRTTATEEVILVTAATGNTLTVTRGFDGTLAQDHSATAKVEHVAAAIDYREANTHIQSTSGHGSAGDLVGVDNAQTMTNKTIEDLTVTGVTAVAAVAVDVSSTGSGVLVRKGGSPVATIDNDGDTTVKSVTTTGANSDGNGIATTAIKSSSIDNSGAVKSGDVSASGKLDVAGNVTVTGGTSVRDIAASGNATVGGGLTVNGDTTVAKLQAAGDIKSNGRVDAGTDITAAGNASFAGSVGVGSLNSGPITATAIASPGVPRVLAARAGVSGVVGPNAGADVGGSASLTFLADHVYEVSGLFAYNITNAVYGDMALTVRLDAASVGVGWRKRFTDQGTNDGHAETIPFQVIFTEQSGAHEVRIGFNGSTYGGNTSVSCPWFKVVDLGKATEVGW